MKLHKATTAHSVYVTYSKYTTRKMKPAEIKDAIESHIAPVASNHTQRMQQGDKITQTFELVMENNTWKNMGGHWLLGTYWGFPGSF